MPGRTEFSVLLPIADLSGTSHHLNKPALIVVDDDPQVLAAVRRDLRSHYRKDYTVIGAHRAKKR